MNRGRRIENYIGITIITKIKTFVFKNEYYNYIYFEISDKIDNKLVIVYKDLL